MTLRRSFKGSMKKGIYRRRSTEFLKACNALTNVIMESEERTWNFMLYKVEEGPL